MTPRSAAAAPALEWGPPSHSARAVARIHVRSVCSGLDLSSGQDMGTCLETGKGCNAGV